MMILCNRSLFFYSKRLYCEKGGNNISIFLETIKKQIFDKKNKKHKNLPLLFLEGAFSEKDYLMIVPEDPRFLLGYGSDGSFECWNEDGRLSIIM